jgi:hypothetical protein
MPGRFKTFRRRNPPRCRHAKLPLLCASLQIRGLDHRQGLDVGLHPDSVEGSAFVEFLRAEKIPFLVFRQAIPGVATGPHIHIGWPSHRYLPR